MNEREFELKLATGKIVKWTGKTGVNAAHNYVDCVQDATVVAWREIQYGIFPYPPQGRGIIG